MQAYVDQALEGQAALVTVRDLGTNNAEVSPEARCATEMSHQSLCAHGNYETDIDEQKKQMKALGSRIDDMDGDANVAAGRALNLWQAEQREQGG